jgi:hypothetical protein
MSEIGSGGACGLPLRVRYAQLIGSSPTEFPQASLLTAPVFWSMLRLSIVRETHHFSPGQSKPVNYGTQPGG